MPSVEVRHSTTYTVTETIDGINHSFDVDFDPSDPQVKISTDGKRAVVGYLSQDSDAGDPRKENDNVGTMVCWHGRYNLGDEQRTDDASEWFLEMAMDADPTFDVWKDRRKNQKGAEVTWEEVERKIQEKAREIVRKNYVMLPLFLYDHSGITMSTGDFGDRWDSGQVGWIYATREKVLDEWGGKSKALTKKIREQAINYLKGEVETYDQFLTGDVWGICYQTYVNVAEEGDEPEWEAYERRGVVGYNGDSTPIMGDMGRDECWGYFGSDYAEEELTRGMENYQTFLDNPIPDEDQPELPVGEGGGI